MEQLIKGTMTKPTFVTFKTNTHEQEVITTKEYFIKPADTFEEFIETLDLVYVDFTSTLKDESISTEG